MASLKKHFWFLIGSSSSSSSMASSSSSTIKVPVFIDTNLETHIAMEVSPDITAGDLKREFRKEHSIRFPSLREITITGLMVKRRSCFYRIPDSLGIKYAFQGLKGSWFLRMDAKSSDEPRDSVANVSKVTEWQKPEDHKICMDNTNTKNKGGRMKRERSNCHEDVLDELLTSTCITNKRKTRRKAQCINEEITDQYRNRFFAEIDKDPGIVSRGILSKIDPRKDVEHTSQPKFKVDTVQLDGQPENMMTKEKCADEEVGDEGNKRYFCQIEEDLDVASQGQLSNVNTKKLPDERITQTSLRTVEVATMCPGGLVKEPLTPVFIETRKEKRRNENCSSEDVVNQCMSKSLCISERDMGVASQGDLCDVHTTKEPGQSIEQTSQQTNEGYTEHLESLMEELLTSRDHTNKKKSRTGKGNCSNKEVVDQCKYGYRHRTEENTGVALEEHLCNVHTREKLGHGVEQISMSTIETDTVCLEGLMEDLLAPVYSAKKKKRRKVKGKCSNEKVVDQGKTKYLLETEEDHLVASKEHLHDIDSAKQTGNRKEQTSRPTVQTDTVCLEGLMEELLAPVDSANKKKTRKRNAKEKSFNEKVVDQGKTKFLPETEEDKDVASREHLSVIDSAKLTCNRNEQTSWAKDEVATASSADAVSLAGIITKYFSELDVDKSFYDNTGSGTSDEAGASTKTELCKDASVLHTPQCAKTPPRLLSLPLHADPSPERAKLGRTEVGKRIIMAAIDLNTPTSTKNTLNNLRLTRVGLSPSSLVRNIVFEVDSDD